MQDFLWVHPKGNWESGLLVATSLSLEGSHLLEDSLVQGLSHPQANLAQGIFGHIAHER